MSQSEDQIKNMAVQNHTNKLIALLAMIAAALDVFAVCLFLYATKWNVPAVGIMAFLALLFGAALALLSIIYGVIKVGHPSRTDRLSLAACGIFCAMPAFVYLFTIERIGLRDSSILAVIPLLGYIYAIARKRSPDKARSITQSSNAPRRRVLGLQTMNLYRVSYGVTYFVAALLMCMPVSHLLVMHSFRRGWAVYSTFESHHYLVPVVFVTATTLLGIWQGGRRAKSSANQAL